MKVFGFRARAKEGFVRNVICNVVIVAVIVGVFCVSFFSRTVSVAYLKQNGAIYNGNTSSKNVTLMVNVYWGTEFLDEMLQIFKNNNVKTTFFVGGCWVAKNNDKLLKIKQNEHEIGNHGYYHKDHNKLSAEQNQSEIYSNHQVVKSVCGVDMNLFAPPSGSFNQTTLSVANNLGYKTIMWSKDTIDWRDKNEKTIFNRATSNVKGGDLILMHPTEKTVLALDDIIKTIKEKGLNLVTVTENIN